MSERMRTLLARPGAWIEAAPEPGGYRLRLSHDRRRRPALTLDEAAFRELARDPGLAVREGGGWKARAGARPATLRPMAGVPASWRGPGP